MQEVARQFKASWHHVFLAVTMAVAWGRERMDLTGITAIGVDEIHWSTKQGFMTLVYQIDGHCKRLLWCGEKRTEATITAFFDWFGEQRNAAHRQTRLNILRWSPRKNVSSATFRFRLKAQRSASKMFCCSSSLSSRRKVTCVGISPFRSSGVRGVALSSASNGSVISHPKGEQDDAIAPRLHDGAVPWWRPCHARLDFRVASFVRH